MWVFLKDVIAFEHMLPEAQKVSTSSLFFSMAGLSRMLQGGNEPSNKMFIIGRLSWSFCPIGLMGDFEEQPRIYFQHLIMEIFTTQRKLLKQS